MFIGAVWFLTLEIFKIYHAESLCLIYQEVNKNGSRATLDKMHPEDRSSLLCISVSSFFYVGWTIYGLFVPLWQVVCIFILCQSFVTLFLPKTAKFMRLDSILSVVAILAGVVFYVSKNI